MATAQARDDQHVDGVDDGGRDREEIAEQAIGRLGAGGLLKCEARDANEREARPMAKPRLMRSPNRKKAVMVTKIGAMLASSVASATLV